MKITVHGLTIPEVTHHRTFVNGVALHYAMAGEDGPPILLLHGFPESWWPFHALIPLLARDHRVIAVDLHGFGDSDTAGPEDDSALFAEDIHALIDQLELGQVHLMVQDISGTIGFRLAATHPEDVRSLIAVEAGLPGFGLEALADVTHGGAWYIGVLGTPGAADSFFAGRETTLIGDFILSAVAATGAVSSEDVAELARGYARAGGWSGAHALYASMLREGETIEAIATDTPLKLPMLAIDRAGSDFTLRSFGAVHRGTVEHAAIDGVGHYIAMEAPERLAGVVRAFVAGL